jgi:alpha-amylase/alpha-mannosidase (GH57 family)
MTAKTLNVVLAWHMHQPYYREGLDGAYHLPWVYLHGMKDYSDMAAHLERHPEMRVVVNFAPVLLEQLDDYALQLADLLHQGTPTQDAMLNLLAGVVPIPADPAERLRLIHDCQRCHAPRMIHPYPAFHRLLRMIGATDDAGVGNLGVQWHLNYLADQYFLDLLTWYHLAWLGHSLKQTPLALRLMKQEQDYSAAQARWELHKTQVKAMAKAEAKVVESAPSAASAADASGSYSSEAESAGTLADDESLAALRDKLADS